MRTVADADKIVVLKDGVVAGKWYAGRIEEERRHLCEYNEDTANGSRLEPVDSRKTSGDRKKLLFTSPLVFLFYFL